MESRPRSAGDVPAVAGVKRPASDVPTLLPAFEPLSSSPPLPRPAKRVARESPHTSPPPPHAWRTQQLAKYPTPVPTSSTGLISSSPPRTTRRPGLQRTASTLSERAPLASVPSIELDAAGAPTLLGRSGKAATYQLSTNKLISRVHVRASFVPSRGDAVPARVELACEGWNGVRVHCQGKAWELGKGDTFASESNDADIMLDVQDARVLLKWPKATRQATTPDTEDENSPSRGGHGGVVRRATLPGPLRARVRLQSPVSPTPVAAGTDRFGTSGESAPIQIYEDDEAVEPAPTQATTQSTQLLTQPLGANRDVAQEAEEDDDVDEENDPLVQSFHVTGENLLSRMAAVAAGSPEQRRLHPEHTSYLTSPLPVGHHPTLELADPASNPALGPLVNHVVNQLAFARVASTPLSTIRGNLPAELKDADPLDPSRPLARATLRAVIEATGCIAEIARSGKDAAGKPLESEYYYVPDRDGDDARRAALVEGLQKPGLRACRKSHKQYYWRKPR